MIFENKVVLVTGANKGIGKEIALSFAKEGAIVVGTSRSVDGASDICQFLQQVNNKGSGIVLDVTNVSQVEIALKSFTSLYGSVDILVNNAGINDDNFVLRMSQQSWNNVLETNLSAVFRLSQLCLKGMLKKRYGRIINISSLVGFSGNAGQANYAASKAGVIAFTKTLALEVMSRNITVNAVAPGLIETDMTEKMPTEQRLALIDRIPAKRMGKPQDVAYAVLFLASDFASYITGQTIHVNGGLLMP